MIQEKMMKTCNMTSLISAYADGQLPEKDRRRVANHLETCDLCRKEYAVIRSIDRLLGGGEDLTPSPGFAAGFWEKVAATEKAGTMGEWSWFRWRDWGFRPVWAAAAATIVIAFGVLLYRQAPVPPDENGDAAGLLMAQDMELYEDFEIVQHLELLEHWETISSMKEI